jgi:sugar (pentulose or hexulose) kinase
MQITADIFGLPTSRPHVYEASGLGAAIVASVGLGLHPDFDLAVRQMTRLGETFQPDQTRHSIYDHIYQRVYLKMYERLRPLYEELYPLTRSG